MEDHQKLIHAKNLDVPTETNNPNFVFSGDAPSDDEGAADEPEPEPESEPQASSSSAPAPALGTDAAEGDEMEELEDDYNAAWEVLDVARTIYQKIVDGLKEGEGNKERMLLSDCYLALGNVSCETGTLLVFLFVHISEAGHIACLKLSTWNWNSG